MPRARGSMKGIGRRGFDVFVGVRASVGYGLAAERCTCNRRTSDGQAALPFSLDWDFSRRYSPFRGDSCDRWESRVARGTMILFTGLLGTKFRGGLQDFARSESALESKG